VRIKMLNCTHTVHASLQSVTSQSDYRIDQWRKKHASIVNVS